MLIVTYYKRTAHKGPNYFEFTMSNYTQDEKYISNTTNLPDFKRDIRERFPRINSKAGINYINGWKQQHYNSKKS